MVDGLEGSEQEKRRLQVILETISGEKTMDEAAEELGLSPARVYELRNQALQAAMKGLERRPAGRPAQSPPTEEEQRLKEMQEQYDELRIHLRAAELREEIALLMPHLLKPGKGDAKKKQRPGKRKRHRR
jgi:transposase